MQDVKVGDVVHVRGVVKSPFGPVGRYVIEFESDTLASLPASTIVHVEPRALVVGDLVTWGDRSCDYVILAIDKDQTWLRCVKGFVGDRTTKPLRDLVRA